MKRVKGRIILGTTAVAAALTIGGCAAGQQTPSGAESNTAVTAQESSTETADTAETAETANTSSAADTGTTILDFEKFDVNENYNNVVYGPPADE